MKNRTALQVCAVLVVIGLYVLFALRRHHASLSRPGGDAAKRETAIHSRKQADFRNSAAPAALPGRTAATKRPAVSSSGTTHSLKSIAVVPYGNGPGQLGRISNTDLRAGPESFWVDKNGRIYVCDSVNDRIKVFSDSGSLLQEMDMGFAATDMVVADSGDMFVLDMSRRVVEQFGPGGEKMGSLTLKDSLADTAARLRVDGTEVALQTHEQKEVVVTKDGKADLLSEVSENAAKAGLKGLNGKRFQTLRNELRQGEVIVFDDSGNVLKKLTLPVEGQVASIMYLGQDRTDNSYFQVETSGANGVELSVYSLDGDGNVFSVIPQMPNDYSSWTAKLLEIDGAGNIYQMLPAEDGVQLNMWRRN